MRTTVLLLVSLLPVTLVAACTDSGIAGVDLKATVGFVNATAGSTISVANHGSTAAGNSNLGFGGSSTCMAVDTKATTSLTFTNAGSGGAIAGFTPSFALGAHYTVIAYTGSTGQTQFATIDNSYAPPQGSAGVRVFNGASSAGSVVIRGGGTAFGSGTAVPLGAAGSFSNVSSGSLGITFATSTGTQIADVGSMSFNAGQNYTVVFGPPATGTGTYRAFLVSGC